MTECEPMLISCDNHMWPPWAPDWLRDQVESPDCSDGTHTRLRMLAKWLTIIFAEHEGEAGRWLFHAAERCDRDVDDGEVERLLAWAEARFVSVNPDGKTFSTRQRTSSKAKAAKPQAATPDLDEIFMIAERGPRLAEYRASSPGKLSSEQRNTEAVLLQWADYAGESDPWICYGRTDCFQNRPLLVVCGEVLSSHPQMVPAPMLGQFGRTAEGHWSEHSLAGTGERIFLVVEFDFTRFTPKGKPTIWIPLLDRCESAAGITVLDMNAALVAHLALQRPIWMTVFSGSKSLQGWFPCRGEAEEELHDWFIGSARRLGACNSTWCKSQFVRMPDGTRPAKGGGQPTRQTIEFFDPEAL